MIKKNTISKYNNFVQKKSYISRQCDIEGVSKLDEKLLLRQKYLCQMIKIFSFAFILFYLLDLH